MASRSILGLIYIMRGLRGLGENPDPVLARYGIDIDGVDPTARIDRSLELRVYSEVAATLGDPLAGLKAGTTFGLAGYGPFTMLVMTCATAYESFVTGIRYQELTYLFGTLRLEPGDPLSALVLTPARLPEPAFRFRVDGEISGTLKLLNDLQAAFGQDLRAERVDMPYPRPPQARAYEELFRCPVSWDHAEARFWLRNEHLQLRLPTADPTAHAYYRRQCDELLAQLRAEDENLSARVRGFLALFSGHYPSADEVAAAFGMTARSFRRQLGLEGSSFRALLEGVRQDKACELLAGGRRPVDEVARQLGYAEAASFIHAFRRWTGQTPAAWRKSTDRPGAGSRPAET